jgi:hypothetical protein
MPPRPSMTQGPKLFVRTSPAMSSRLPLTMVLTSNSTSPSQVGRRQQVGRGGQRTRH